MIGQVVNVNRDIRAEQRAAAEAFRQEMSAQGTFVVRLLSSPGSGKTSLLEKTAEILGDQYKLGVLVGDVQTDRDAQRLQPFAPTVQLTTGGACHLEIPLVEKGFPQLGRQDLDFLFIEDVGNLICPASHDLGEHLRVILLSTTEGDDKPGKYPKAFRTSHAVVVSKIDLLPHVPFSIPRARQDAMDVQAELEFFQVSSLTGTGLPQWCHYLEIERRKLLARRDHVENEVPEPS